MNYWTQLTRDVLASGVTQTQLAKVIGINQGSVSCLASGETRCPSADVGDKLRAFAKRRKVKLPKV